MMKIAMSGANGYAKRRIGATLVAIATFALGAALTAPAADAQGSRKDDVVFGPGGHPVAGATVTICQPDATGTPCSPLATVYTDATLTVPAANPFQTDGIGNYHFYAPAGRYVVQISGPGITGTITYRDVILAPDVSSSGSGNNISAFGLTLGGNLSVAGNATINGALSAGSFAPSSLSVAGNETVAGPRPRVDVTAYGAKGDGSTDDTAAIQAAINVACTSLGGGGAVFFPAPTGSGYKIVQPQSPSNSPIFTIPVGCQFAGQGLAITGGSGNWNQVTNGGGLPPMINIKATCGASPGLGPVFYFAGMNIYLENVSFTGCNQAVQIDGRTNPVTWHFKNVNLAIQTNSGQGICSSNPTCTTDNVPLAIYNDIEGQYDGGALNNTSGNLPTILLAEEIGASGNGTGLMTFKHLYLAGTGTGGGVVFDGRSGTGQVANVHFSDIETEAAGSTPFLTVQAEVPVNQTGEIYMEHVGASDNNPGTPCISLSGSNWYPDITIVNSRCSGTSSPAIVVNDGTILGCFIIGSQFSGHVAVDASGNAVSGCVTQTNSGLDYFSGINSLTHGNLRTNAVVSNGFFGNTQSCPIGMTKSGDTNRSLCLDPFFGLGFGLGGKSGSGYDTRFYRNGNQAVSLALAQADGPTSPSATLAAGGNLSVGTTYYYYVESTIVSSSCAAGNLTGPSQEVSATPTAGNQTVNLSWTAGTGSVIAGYCVWRGTSANGESAYNFVSGAGTTSLSDNGSVTFTSGTPSVVNNTFPASPQYTWNLTGLGVNTASPQYSLDVNGAAAVNSLNGVQKAERFTGADASAKINACLVAASTTSGVCDARGMTGALTGSTHITIPATTVLLWGNGQLTISDSTTNDAVALGGDGASLYGTQPTGPGLVSQPQDGGYIKCGTTGCTTVKNPNAATDSIEWNNIRDMSLIATGAGSKVIDLTSIGHADIENNRIILGSGGGAYGIYGDTSSPNRDSTNTLFKHNEINAQQENDTCLYLAGIFNITQLEINVCYLAAESTNQRGFVFEKDSNDNYPNNVQLYGNNCEQGGAAASFGVVCYDIRGAQNVTIGPNNRCEKVYACFKFPSNGSAIGFHVIDPYLSLSNSIQVLPNEPSTSMIAIDNAGHNWLPSMHYGMNDLAGRSLLGNTGFEGWQNSTTLYYWGGVSSTFINQPGSGIYAQQSSASAPADSTTQGSYSVAIGDNATAGLGVHSQCIQVDATMQYTLAFRVASTSTSVNFRPGFRFYSDPNCTEANRITSVATNARALAAANYAGYSTLVGTGPNWQSTNASLTYNNGITCDCNVTGFDWQVATANLWTPTRNYAITFRIPNAYSDTTKIGRSMRVFILENTAANPNKIYVDDVVLSQGAVSQDVPFPGYVADSGNPTVWDNLTVKGSLTVGSSALPAALTSGSPTNGNCASFTGTNIQDSGSPCPTLFNRYSMGIVQASTGTTSNNAVNVSVIYLPNIQFSQMSVNVGTIDGAGLYSWAITDMLGNVKCTMSAAVNLSSSGTNTQSCSQGTVTLTNGPYIFAFTGNSTTGKISYSGTVPLPLTSATSSSTSSSGVMTFPISIPAAGSTFSSYGQPALILR